MKIKFNYQKENDLKKRKRKNIKGAWTIVLRELGFWGLSAFCLIFYVDCSREACDGRPELDKYNECLPFETPEIETDPACVRSGDSTNPENPLRLCSYADLELMRENLAGHYILGQNVDMSTMMEESDAPSDAPEDMRLWEPIGNSEEPFRGSFDGGGHVISNLRIIKFSQAAGFFGNLAGAEARITRVFLESVQVQGRDYVGALVGQNEGGSIQNSYSTGLVNGNRVGGLVGEMLGGSIENSYFQGELRGGSAVGGLLGYNNGGQVRRSYALAEISYSVHSVGGLVGYNTNGALIENSYASASVHNSGVNSGGLVGRNNQSTIRNSYALGEVVSNNAFTWSQGTGGLVGYNKGGSIENSYTNSSVSLTVWLSSDAQVGGLVGYNENGVYRGLNYFVSTNESDSGSNGIGNEASCSGCSQMSSSEMRGSLNEAKTDGLAWTSPPWIRLNEEGWPCLEDINFGRGGCP